MSLIDITNFFTASEASKSPLKVVLKNFDNKDNIYKQLKVILSLSTKLEMYTNDPRYMYVKIHLKSGIIVHRTFREDGVILGTGLDLIFQSLGETHNNELEIE